MIPSACAQPLVASAQINAQIGPVVVYGMYLLLAVAYIVALFAIFLRRENRDRVNAMEMFKTLNAFFIGAISGKFV